MNFIYPLAIIGILFLIFGVSDFLATLITTVQCNKTWWPNNYIISRKFRKTITPLLSNNWKITKINSYIAERIDKNLWRIYIRVENKLNKRWTNDFAKFNSKTNKIDTRLFDGIKIEEEMEKNNVRF